MRKKLIFVDYENVQDLKLDQLLDSEVLVKIFHNENQIFSGDFVNLALSFGKERFELIKMNGNGKNALDFHIAFYLGKLTEKLRNVTFVIISKDNGFGPLVKHISEAVKVDCYQFESIEELEKVEKSTIINPTDKYQIAIDALTKCKTHRPKRIKSLKNQIHNIFHNKFSECEIEKIIEKLKANDYIAVDGSSITFKH